MAGRLSMHQLAIAFPQFVFPQFVFPQFVFPQLREPLPGTGERREEACLVVADLGCVGGATA